MAIEIVDLPMKNGDFPYPQAMIDTYWNIKNNKNKISKHNRPNKHCYFSHYFTQCKHVAGCFPYMKTTCWVGCTSQWNFQRLWMVYIIPTQVKYLMFGPQLYIYISIYLQHACICKSSVCVEATTALLLSKWDDSQAVKIFKMRLSNAYL